MTATTSHRQSGAAPQGAAPETADAAAMDLVRRYRPAIDWAINGACVPQHDRADVRQEVAIRLLMRIRKLGPLGAGSHLSFVITVARRAATDFFRRGRMVQPGPLPSALEATLADTAPRPDELLERQDGYHVLCMAIASLPPIKRIVVRRVMAGASLADVAEEMSLSYTNVKVLHHRAVNDLRSRLNPKHAA